MVVVGALLFVGGVGAVAIALVRRIRRFLSAPGYYTKKMLMSGPSYSAEARAITSRIQQLMPDDPGDRTLVEDVASRSVGLAERIEKLEGKRAEVDRYLEVDVYGSELGKSMDKQLRATVKRLEKRRKDLGDAMRRGVKTLKEIEMKVATLRMCASDEGAADAFQSELEDMSRDLDVFIEESDNWRRVAGEIEAGAGVETASPSRVRAPAALPQSGAGEAPGLSDAPAVAVVSAEGDDLAAESPATASPKRERLMNDPENR